MQRVADLVGRALGGRYHLVAPLGAGASAVVYLAEDEALGRRVAVKVLHSVLASDAAFLRRFRAEARAVARLRHPHIVTVFDWGEADDHVYLVLEHMAGGSLRSLLDAGHRLSPEQAAAVGLATARGLEHAHRRGLVHRDIKPANLLFDEEGRLAIADFGVARAMADATWTEPAGAMMGTVRYSSPEQAAGAAAEGPSDVYSLALVLVEAVTGEVPFSADTTVATLMARQGKRFEAGAALGPLGPVLEAATAPEPAERPDSTALVRLLEALQDMPPPAPLPLAPPPPMPGDAGGRPGPGLENPWPVRGSAGAPARSDEPTRLGWRGDPTVAIPVPPPGEGAGPDVAPGRSRGRRRMLGALAVVAAIAVVAAGVWVLLFRVRLFTPSEPVPALRGLSLPQAEARLTAVKLHYLVGPARYDDAVPSGEVAAQAPASGGIKQGGTVTLYPSRGAAPRAVPDLTGLDEETAVQRLTAAGFSPQVTHSYNETVPAGTVVSWSPSQGPQPKGSQVTLVVSSGPAPRTIPDFSGQTYDQAASQLQSLGLVPVRADVYSSTVAQGQVVSTDPPAGASAPKGANVTVSISKGPQMVKVPDVTNETVSQATSDLEAAGLNVDNVYGPPNHRVFLTDPGAGSTVAAGTAVTLYTKP
ncbi:MAG TPA: PASTA domain-containing protein [Acidimicrobiales bacterium]|nr:PASTA domain-containing protein [Acidimicrobiales bacterium]